MRLPPHHGSTACTCVAGRAPGLADASSPLSRGGACGATERLPDRRAADNMKRLRARPLMFARTLFAWRALPMRAGGQGSMADAGLGVVAR